MGEKVGKFEDLEVWKEGMRLATKIYRALNACFIGVRPILLAY